MSISSSPGGPHPQTQSELNGEKSFVLPYLMFAIAAGVFYTALYFYYPLPLSEGLLVGPDSYMQIVRLREFIDVGEWHHNLVTRSNAPYGEISHWTKPFKLLLLLFSVPAPALHGRRGEHALGRRPDCAPPAYRVGR